MAKAGGLARRTTTSQPMFFMAISFHDDLFVPDRQAPTCALIPRVRQILAKPHCAYSTIAVKKRNFGVISTANCDYRPVEWCRRLTV
jgi:hypothetical protein